MFRLWDLLCFAFSFFLLACHSPSSLIPHQYAVLSNTFCSFPYQILLPSSDQLVSLGEVIVQQLNHVWLFCNPMDCSRPGSPVLHYLPEFAHTHAHWVDDAIQLSRVLLHPSPPAFSLSQDQDLFQWVNSSQQLAKLLKLQLQNQSFQWVFRTDFL